MVYVQENNHLIKGKGRCDVIFTHELCKVRRQSEGELGLTNGLDAGRVILSIFQGLRKKSIFYAQYFLGTGTFKKIQRDKNRNRRACSQRVLI